MRISDWSSDVCSSDLAAASLAARGTDCRPLNVSHAFHSARLDPILDDLQQAASRLTMRPAAIPIASNLDGCMRTAFDARYWRDQAREAVARSEEHTSELQSLMRISYAVFCLKKKTNQTTVRDTQPSEIQ